MNLIVGLNLATLVAACTSLVLSSLALVPHLHGLAARLKHLLVRMREMAVLVAAMIGVVSMVVLGLNYVTRHPLRLGFDRPHAAAAYTNRDPAFAKVVSQPRAPGVQAPTVVRSHIEPIADPAGEGPLGISDSIPTGHSRDKT